MGTEGQTDRGAFARGLLGVAAFTLVVGFFGLKPSVAWGVLLMVLAALTAVAALFVARSDGGDKPVTKAFTGGDGAGGVVGGALFSGFVLGVILHSAVPRIASPIFLALHFALIGAVYLYAKRGIVRTSDLLALAERLGWPEVTFSTSHSHSYQKLGEPNTVVNERFTVTHRIGSSPVAWRRWVDGLEEPMTDRQNVVSMEPSDVRKSLLHARRELRRIEKGRAT